MKKLAIVFLFVAALVFLLQPSAFSFNSSNWYYTSFLQNPSENAASCNFSPLFHAYNLLWKPFEFAGVSIQAFWLLLSIAIAAIGVFLQYKWVELASGSKTIALAAALLSFVFIDFLAPVTLPAPRHFAFFIFMPLAYYAFFSLLRKINVRSQILLTVSTAALIATNAMFGLFFAVSIASFYVALVLAKKLDKYSIPLTAIPLLVGVAIATPILHGQVSLLSSTTPSFSYSNWGEWGINMLGTWTANPAKIFYAKGQTFFLGLLFAISLFFSAKFILSAMKRQNTEDEDFDFKLFAASNVLVGTVILFTPLGGLIAKIISPGVFVENFIKFIPFYLAIPLGLAYAVRQSLKLAEKKAQIALALGLLLVLAYPLYSYASAFSNPQPSEKDFLGGLSAKEIVGKADGGVILTDFYTSYLLSTAGGGKAIGPNPGYNVCLSQKQTLEITNSNLLFSANSPQHARDLAEAAGVKMVFLNEHFWEWRLNERTASSGYAYPQSFEEAKKVFDSYGWKNEGSFYYPA